MSGTPLVSVVVPTYGRPDSLAAAVESVAAQTYDDVELVVVDDHSPEPVAETVRAVDSGSLEGITVVRHAENRGANAARGTGIAESAGSLVAFLDDDDRWAPSYLERVVDRFAREGPAVGVVIVGARVVDGAGDRVGSVAPDAYGDVVEGLLRGSLRAGSFSRFVVRRRVITAAGPPDPAFPSWQDKEWHLRLAQQTRYASIPDSLVTKRATDLDQITDNYPEKRDRSYGLLLEAHRPLARSYGRATERRFVATLTRTLGFSALRNGYYREALGHVLRAVLQDPTDRLTYLYLLVAIGGPVTFKPAKHLRRGLERLAQSR